MSESGSRIESRYRLLFENSPLSLWELDWSEVKSYVDRLRQSGVGDLHGYFLDHPDDVAACARLIKVVNVNQVTLRLMGASDKAELTGHLARIFTDRSLDLFREKLIALVEGRRSFEAEAPLATVDGHEIQLAIYVSVPPESDETLDTVLVSMLDITERRNTEQALRKEQETLRQMLDHLERDRQLIAYEIHDGLAQQLTGALLVLQSFPEQSEMTPNASQTLDSAIQLLREALAEARRLIGDLRPPQLKGEGVRAAIEDLVVQARDRWGLHVDFVHQLGEGRFSPVLETAVFRIVQEALNNARRHARTDRVQVELTEEPDRLRLEIRDWGVGFDLGKVPTGHFGLESIRERARLLGGHAKWETAPGQGTRLTVELPVPRASPERD